jgi:hypothetical protein
MRNKAESAANNVREYGNNTLERSKSKFRSAVNDLTNYKDEVEGRVKAKVSGVAEAGREVVEQAKSRAKGASNDLNDSVQDA